MSFARASGSESSRNEEDVGSEYGNRIAIGLFLFGAHHEL